MSRSSLDSAFRKFSQKQWTDFRLARSKCMYVTSVLPVSCKEKHRTELCAGLFLSHQAVIVIVASETSIHWFLPCSTCWMSVMAASALFRFRQARITLAPLLAKCRAVAFPMPVFPPEEETPQGQNNHVALECHGSSNPVTPVSVKHARHQFDVLLQVT